MRLRTAIVGLLLLPSLFGCSVNPVTGENEFNFVSEAREIEMGLTYYEPLQQVSGGLYTRDQALVNYVNDVVKRLAKVSDRPELPYQIVILDTGSVNAWALPGGKLAIHRGLLQELSTEAELAAVLGHEMVHAAARHSARQMERGSLLMAGLALADAALGDNKNRTLILAGASIGTYLLSLKYSRVDEKEADHYGMIYMERAGYDPQQAVTLQETFVRLFEDEKPDVFEQMLASHPPSHARVEANQALANTMQKGLFIGEEEYNNATKQLRADIPAYKKIAVGLEALSKGELELAKTQAEKVLKTHPNLHQAHRLMGQVHFQEDSYSEAIYQFSAALRLHPNFYALFYERGLAHEKAGHLVNAKKDYVASLQLLKTEDAASALKRVNKLIRREARKAKRLNADVKK